MKHIKITTVIVLIISNKRFSQFNIGSYLTSGLLCADWLLVPWQKLLL